MSIFGDFETVGEPLATPHQQAHFSAVWKAKKTGTADGHEYIIKCYSPHRKATEPGDQESLDRDRSLEFLEGIKQHKKALADGARHLVPVHDLGIAAEGAWYASDFYPRGSLMTLIDRRAKMDTASLSHIVRSIVAGCLGLKNVRSLSHGNLKASNVFLVGKPRPLSKTPIVLADPFPSAPLQLARLVADDRRTVNELLHEVMEVQDLRALGEIILQLVERRAVRSGYCDPPARSPVWDDLGKDGERWRQLCTQLLDPRLSLAEINLALLARKYPMRAGGGKTVMVAAGVVATGLAGVALFGLVKARHTHKFDAALALAKSQLNTAQNESGTITALSVTNLIAARLNAGVAHNLRPQNHDAIQLSSDVETEAEKRYVLLMLSVTNDIEKASFAEAEQKLKLAQRLEPSNPEPANVSGHIELNQLLADSQRWMAQAGYAEAQASYGKAATLAQQLNDSNSQTQAESGRQCAGDLAKAAAARQAEDAVSEVNWLQEAGKLQKVPGLENWLTEAQQRAAGQATLAQNRQNLTDTLSNANQLLAQGNYNGAETAFASAEVLAKKLDDSPSQNEAEQGHSCADNLAKAAAAKQAGSISDEITFLQKAKAIRSVSGLDSWLAEARQRAAGQATLAENRQKLATALKTANQLLSQGNYIDAEKAFANAGALAKQVNDRQALDQAGQGQQCTDDLAKAAAAKQAGSIGDEIAFLKKAKSVWNLPGLDTWLADASQRAAGQAKLAQNRQKLSDTMKSANQLLAQGDYSNAETGFANAAVLASQLGNPESKTQAEHGRQCADALAKAAAAKQAGSIDEEVSQLKSAKKILEAPGVDEWYTRAVNCQKAVTDGRTASDRSDFQTAAAKADDALKIEPNCVSAKALKQQATDAGSALADFNQGNYAAAGSLCSAHADVDFFKKLAVTSSAESNHLAQFTASYNGGDYGFIGNLAKADYATKPPFADLLTNAKNEQAFLLQLQNLESQTNWQGVLDAIKKKPDNTKFISKPPFQELSNWAQHYQSALADEQQAKLSKLDAQLEQLCIMFRVGRPSWLNIPGADHNVGPINEDLTFAQQDNYVNFAKQLKERYGDSAKENKRDEIIGQVIQAIQHHNQ